MWVHFKCFMRDVFFAGATGDRDSDDGRPLSLVNRRPSISAPISSRKPSGSRIHTPPPASPAELLIGDGASSTPKRLTDGKLYAVFLLIITLSEYLFGRFIIQGDLLLGWIANYSFREFQN